MLTNDEEISTALTLIEDTANIGVKNILLLQLMDYNPHCSVKLSRFLGTSPGNANKAVAKIHELGLIKMDKTGGDEFALGRPAENMYETTDLGREFLVKMGIDLGGECELRSADEYKKCLETIDSASNFGVKSLVLMQLMEYGRYDSSQISKFLKVTAGNANKAVSKIVNLGLVEMRKDENRRCTIGRPAQNVYKTTKLGRTFMEIMGINVPSKKKYGKDKAKAA